MKLSLKIKIQNCPGRGCEKQFTQQVERWPGSIEGVIAPPALLVSRDCHHPAVGDSGDQIGPTLVLPKALLVTERDECIRFSVENVMKEKQRGPNSRQC